MSTVAKITDVLSLQVSLAVVKIATLLGLDKHGDHVVKVDGCDVVSGASMMLFKNMLRAAYGATFVGSTGVLKSKTTRTTSSGGLVLDESWTACCRWSQVPQQVGIVAFSERVENEGELL